MIRLGLLYFLFLAVSLPLAQAQEVKFQFIHNSADSTLQWISLWRNGQLWADSIALHEATPMTSIAPNDSDYWEVRKAENSTETIYSWSSQFLPGSNHIVVLNGHTDSLLQQPFQPLNIQHFDQALETSASLGSVDIIFFHGATDLDTVDIAETELFELTAFDQLPFGQFSGYISLFSADYEWSILSPITHETLGEYALPITSLAWAGKAITIVTGGYYNQASNNNGKPLGMWATTSDGGPMICLQPVQWNLKAYVQFLHNSTLPASQSIQILTDQSVWHSNLNSHEATPFLPFSAGKDVVLKVSSNLLGGPVDSIWSDTIHLFSGNRYQLFWYGGISPETPSQLYIHEYQTDSASNDLEIRLNLFHGASLWNQISLLADTTDQLTLAEGIPFGSITDSIDVAIANEEWLLFSGNDSITAVQAPIDSLVEYHPFATILTCDDTNQAGISVWMSNESGGPMHELATLVIPETPVYCALQLVHASADTAIQSIDVWIDDSLFMSGFQFESASAFLTVQCNDSVTVRITAANNPFTNLFSDTLLFAANQHHRLILWGILHPEYYNPAPPLNWHLEQNISMNAAESGNTDIQFFHASTDLGILQVNENTVPIVPFFNQISIGELSYTQSISASGNYGLELINLPAQFLYGAYALPALNFGWQTQHITIISTGFRQPLNNSNGETLQLWALEANGSMTALPQFVSVENSNEIKDMSIYPNPAKNIIQVQANAIHSGTVNLQIMDSNGEIFSEKTCVVRDGYLMEFIEIDTLPVGNYIICVSTELFTRCLNAIVVR